MNTKNIVRGHGLTHTLSLGIITWKYLSKIYGISKKEEKRANNTFLKVKLILSI